MKTSMHFPHLEKQWFHVDAQGQVLGRLATKIAMVLMGKHKPEYLPHQDMGDYVVVTNAAEIVLTGKKWQNKKYYHHTGYPGGLREETALHLLGRKPEKILIEAVSCMLPKNKLRRDIIKKLKVYAGAEHMHAAQNPVPLK